ncbi:MAG: carbohydrate ABC transporter permease [Chloroflexi bacterium]|nr:carbohydrate ABC transporter permease [Chloroflexota bacterium]
MSTVSRSAALSRAGARGASRRALLGRVALHAVLVVAFLLFIFPFYWMLTSSLKPLADIFAVPIQFWPARPSPINYLEVLGLAPSPVISGRRVTMAQAFLNSSIVAATYTGASVFFSSLAGFSFAKLRFWGSRVLFVVMLATMMIPNSVGLIPNYIIVARLGWIDTWLPLIVPSVASAFGVFWMRQYISSVPDEMIEAAQIDGCGPFAVYSRIVLPVIGPGLAALTIFKFMGNWNAFFGPLIYLKTAELYTVPIFLALLNTSVQGYPIPYQLVFAAAAISIVPILVIFVGAQRYFIAGLTAGSVK